MRLFKKFDYSVVILMACICLLPQESWAGQDREKKAKNLAQYMMGIVYDLQGETEEAIKRFEKAAEHEDNYAVHLRLGADYARLGKLKEAIEELNYVLEYNPLNVQARYLLALIYSTQKKFDKAALEYENILTSFSQVEPENIEIYGYLGQLYYSQKEYDKAISQFEIILSFNPNDADMTFLLGSLYLETDKRNKAVELFERVLKIDSEHDTCLNSLGYLYAEDGIKLDEAEELVEHALKIDPDNGAYLDSLGWVYYKKGQYRQALKYLKEAENITEDPLIYEHIGDVYHQLERAENAKKYWEISLELLPNQDQVLEKLNALK